MIVSAHQPHFLPWLGYLNKVANSDVFIWLNTVQYRKNYYQNRTRIAAPAGGERWLTIPVHASLETRILDVTVADAQWKTRTIRTIEQTYGRAPRFAECWPPLREAIVAADDRLDDLNFRLFQATLCLLGLASVSVVRASDLPVRAEEPTERLVALCRHVGGDAYIAGRGGRNYMRLDAFDAARIRVHWQEVELERTAHRRASGETVAGLSVIDALFHVGPHRTLELTRSGWAVPR